MANLNIRDVPEQLTKKVKAQAALSGLPLREYVIKVLRDNQEWMKPKAAESQEESNG